MSFLDSFFTSTSEELGEVPVSLIRSYCQEHQLDFEILEKETLEKVYGESRNGICDTFHAYSLESSHECRRSIYAFVSRLRADTSFLIESCPSGFCVGMIPIHKNEEINKVLMVKPVFFERPNLENYTKIAHNYDFPVRAYLNQVKKIPIIERRHFADQLSFLSQLIKAFENKPRERRRSDFLRLTESFEVVTDSHNNLVQVDTELEILVGKGVHDYLGMPMPEYFTAFKALPKDYFLYTLRPLVLTFLLPEGDWVPFIFYKVRREFSRIVWKVMPGAFLTQSWDFRRIVSEDRTESILEVFEELLLILDFDGNLIDFSPFSHEDPLNEVFNQTSSLSNLETFPDFVLPIIDQLGKALNTLQINGDYSEFKIPLTEKDIYKCLVQKIDENECMVILQNISETELEIQRQKQIESMYTGISRDLKMPFFSYDIKNQKFLYKSDLLDEFLEIDDDVRSDIDVFIPTDRMSSEDAVRLRTELQELSEGHLDQSVFYFRLLGRDGNIRIICEKLVLQRDSLGNPSGLNGLLEDVTDQKGDEEALQYRADFLKELVWFYQRFYFGMTGRDVWQELMLRLGKKTNLEHQILFNLSDGKILKIWTDPSVVEEDFETLDSFFINSICQMGWKQKEMGHGEIFYEKISKLDLPDLSLNTEGFADKRLILLPVSLAGEWKVILLAWQRNTENLLKLFDVDEMRMLARAASLMLTNLGSDFKKS